MVPEVKPVLAAQLAERVESGAGGNWAHGKAMGRVSGEGDQGARGGGGEGERDGDRSTTIFMDCRTHLANSDSSLKATMISSWVLSSGFFFWVQYMAASACSYIRLHSGNLATLYSKWSIVVGACAVALQVEQQFS